MNPPAITLEELLDDNDVGTRKWQAWFTENPAALEVPCDIYNSGTVRGMLKHIFAVELRHSQRLRGQEVIAYDSIPTGSLEDLFRLHIQAIGNLETFLDSADDPSLEETIPLQTVSTGTVQATRRKLFVHIMLHSIRHWAQLSTTLRAAGHNTDWPKDFLFSEAIR